MKENEMSYGETCSDDTFPTLDVDVDVERRGE